jgi:hypothetical protein
MKRSWCTTVAALAALIAIATTSADAAGPCVSLHVAAPGSDPAASPAFVVIRDLPVPAAGATIVISAHAHALAADTRLATLFIVGSSRLTGTVQRTVQSPLQTAPGVGDALARDAHATVTIQICRPHETAPCTTVGPLPITVERGTAGST